jgi:hypothetical protein
MGTVYDWRSNSVPISWRARVQWGGTDKNWKYFIYYTFEIVHNLSFLIWCCRNQIFNSRILNILGWCISNSSIFSPRLLRIWTYNISMLIKLKKKLKKKKKIYESEICMTQLCPIPYNALVRQKQHPPT